MMSIFQCEKCGCVENTALSNQGFRGMVEVYDWTGIEDRKGKLLCSACGPETFNDGKSTGHGKWHNEFDRVFLEKGKFETDMQGNLKHIKTGRCDFRSFAILKTVKHVKKEKNEP